MSVLTYSTAAASNSLAMPAVGSLAEGVTPINLINNFMRQQAADIAQLYGDAIAGIYTTGTATAYVVTTASGHTAYLNTMALRLRFHVDAAGGATTINVNGLGVKSLKVFVATGVRDPIAGEIKTDMVCDCIYVVALNCVVVTGQAIDAVLTAIAALSTTGLISRTGAGAVATRTITAGTNMAVTNGDGVAGNPTVAALYGETIELINSTTTAITQRNIVITQSISSGDLILQLPNAPINANLAETYTIALNQIGGKMVTMRTTAAGSLINGVSGLVGVGFRGSYRVLLAMWSPNIGGWTISATPSLLYGSSTYDPPSIAAGAETTTTVTVTGAALGDLARASFTIDSALVYTARVSTANTVTVTLRNNTAAAIDLLSGTLSVEVNDIT